MYYYVYILKCHDSVIYVGCTNNLKERINRHKNGSCKYTKGHLPFKLMFFCCFPNKYLAFDFEKYLKSCSGRAFISKHLLK